MQSINKKKAEQNSHNSAVSHPLWRNSTSSDMPHSQFTYNLNLNLDTLPQKHHQVKQFGCHYEDQDSPSTQSTSQSHQNSGSTEKGRLEINVEHVDRSRHSGGNGDFLYHAAQAHSNQSVVHNPYHGDPFYGSMMAAYGPQIQTQLCGIAPNRVPLPDLAEAEPIYVNAKQYRGIMRRRELRAKLEAQNKLVKARKPYLHESRHRHAMNRARGSGGRFLNSKKCQDSEAALVMEGESGKNKSTNRPERDLTNSEVLKRDNTNHATPSTFSSSNAGQSDMVFSTFPSHPSHPSHMVGNLQDGGNILRNGAQPRVPVIR